MDNSFKNGTTCLGMTTPDRNLRHGLLGLPSFSLKYPPSNAIFVVASAAESLSVEIRGRFAVISCAIESICFLYCMMSAYFQ